MKRTNTRRTTSVFVAAVAAAAVSQAYSASYEVSGFNTGISVAVGTGSVTITNTPNPVPFDGNWNFDFNGSTVDFSGNLYLGDYSSYTVVSIPFLGSMNGTITYVGANQAVAGTGNWDAGTNTLSYHIPTGGPNSSIASTYTEVSSSCTGSGSVLGNTVCGTRGNTTPEWEGLTLELTFASDLSSFSGTITAIEKSGSGLTANTTTSTYTIEGVAEVPVPAAAWLLGSGLAGLAGIARRRNRNS